MATHWACTIRGIYATRTGAASHTILHSRINSATAKQMQEKVDELNKELWARPDYSSINGVDGLCYYEWFDDDHFGRQTWWDDRGMMIPEDPNATTEEARDVEP